jgi:hypothetical protein
VNEHGIVTLTIPIETLESRVRAAVSAVLKEWDGSLAMSGATFQATVNLSTEHIVGNIVAGHTELKW